MSTVRRVFFYILALITLGILAAGVINLLSLSFDTIISNFTLAKVGDIRGQLSLGIAMIVIGCPLWLLFWGTIQRQAGRSSEEYGSALRAFFLNFVIIVSAFSALFALDGLVVWLMGGLQAEEFSSNGAAIFITAGAIWYYHWRLSRTEGHPTAIAKTLWRWYAYILAAAGLVWLSVGIVQIVNAAFIALPIWQGDIVRTSFWNNGSRSSLSWILIGGGAWVFHWLYTARGDLNSSLRQVYFYLFAILGGAITGLVALTQTIYKVIFWLLGGGRDINTYFQFLGWTLPAMLVAAFIWFYHLRMAEEEALQIKDRPRSARRVHYYLMAFVGVGALVGGLIVMLGIPLDAIIRSIRPETVVTGPEWWTNQLSLGLALLFVSIPIWLYYWSRVIGMVEAGGVIERGARSRRIYLFGIIGIAVVTVAADLVNVVYQILNGLLTANFGIDVLVNMKWSLQTVFIAVPLLLYHLSAVRKDLKLGAEKAAPVKNVMVLVYDKNSPDLALIENKLGYRVRVVQYAGEIPAGLPKRTEDELDRLAAGINSSAVQDVLVVLLEGQARVLPYKK
ncbi:MAG: DUF5671 domain-containing protein [Dehalococcoidia bacterium]